MTLRTLIASAVFATAGLLAATAPGSAADNRVTFTPDALDAWATDYFGTAAANHQFSGAVMTVVQDGQIIYAKGFGYADWQKKTPVDPDETGFRIGSTTKTFTATGIAQLIDAGLIAGIDAPVNDYLRRDTLPTVNGQDISLKQLLTHTGGFANITFNIGTDQRFDTPLSADNIRSHRPDIVRAPGGRAVYSNYASAMLGAVIEDVTNTPIEQYFAEQIFAPLGMDKSVLLMDLDQPDYLGQTYTFTPDGSAHPFPFWSIHPFFGPAGSIVSTGTDMARFMIAHLDGDHDGNANLGLSAPTMETMHGRLQENHPAAQAFGMIFLNMDWAGHPGYGHGGDWPGFHSIMWMLPESNAGVFVSLMAEAPIVPVMDGITGADYLQPKDGITVATPLTNLGTLVAFLDHFLGPDKPELRVAGAPPVRPELATDNLVGHYRHEYRAYGLISEILDLLNGPAATLTVEKAGDNALTINGEGPYRHLGNGVYWNPDLETSPSDHFDKSAVWNFAYDDAEQRPYVVARITIDPFVKVTALQSPLTMATLLKTGALLALTGLAALFWRYRAGIRPPHWARAAAVATPLAVVATPAALLMGYPEGSGGFLEAFLLGYPGHFEAVALLANLTALLTVALASASVLGWWRQWGGTGWGGTLTRVHLSLVTLGGILVSVAFTFFRLTGWNLP